MRQKDAPTNRWRAEPRYFPLIIALAFLIFSISAFFICYRHHVVSTEQALHEDRSTANILSMFLNEHLYKIVSLMESYSHRPLLIRAAVDKNAEKAKVHLISLTESNYGIDNVIVTDRQGTPWAAYPERPEALGKNFAYRNWYKGVSKEWRPYISDAYVRVGGEKDAAIAIAVPLFNETGEAIGILQNTYRTVSIGNMIKQLHLDSGASISVADREGQIIYGSRYVYEKEIKTYPFYPGMKKAAANHRTFTVNNPDLGGATRYISYHPVGNIGWTVFVGRDKRSIFMSEITYHIQVTAIALLLLLSVVVFLLYARKYVTGQLIREQFEAEKKIRAGQERFKSYIDLTMQLAWTTNDKGEIVEDNPLWSKYTGRGYEACKGFGWIEDIHPDDRDLVGLIWGKAVAEKSFYETEYRVRRYDGVYRDYLARGIPLLTEDGTVREWVGTCIDITERKLSEEALKKSEAKFRNLFDNALEGVYQSTPEGRLITANMAFARMFGYESAEDLINSVTDLAGQMYESPDDRKIAVGIFGEKGYIQDFECRMRRKDGSIFWARYDGRFTETSDGTPCFQGFVIDITDRKEAEEALCESERFFRSTLDGLSSHIAVIDDAGEIVFTNKAYRDFAERNGIEPGGVSEGTNYLAVCDTAKGEDSEEAGAFAQGIREVFSGRRPSFEREYPCHSPDEQRWFLGRVTPFAGEGFRRVVVAHESITERKLAEADLRNLMESLEVRVKERTAELQAVNQELEAFSYSVSHDLRSPLRAIDGFSNILMKEYTDRLDAEGVRLLNVIRTNTKHMDQLIVDMLSLSRVSKIELQHAGIDMAAMAHSIYQEIVPSEVRRKFSFSVALLPDGDGDPVLLRHVWSNLLTNAVKFTLPREERRIEISGHKEQGMNVYAVRDTGVGFNPDYVHKLFGIFQRLHKSSEFEGNGVGLAIVRRIVERHGGRVWAEGKINGGAAFFFSLPVKEVKDEPHE